MRRPVRNEPCPAWWPMTRPHRVRRGVRNLATSGPAQLRRTTKIEPTATAMAGLSHVPKLSIGLRPVHPMIHPRAVASNITMHRMHQSGSLRTMAWAAGPDHHDVVADGLLCGDYRRLTEGCPARWGTSGPVAGSTRMSRLALQILPAKHLPVRYLSPFGLSSTSCPATTDM